MDLLSTWIQDHQCYTLIKCATIFTSWLYSNHNNIPQTSDIRADQYKAALDTKIQAMFTRFEAKCDKQNVKFDKQVE